MLELRLLSHLVRHERLLLVRRTVLIRSWDWVLAFWRGRQTAVCRGRRPLRLLLVAWQLLTRWAGLAWWRLLLLGWHTIALIVGVHGLRRYLRVLQVSKAVASWRSPVVSDCHGARYWAWWRWVLRMSAPLWARWSAESAWLISLGVNVLRKRRSALVGQTVGRLTLEQRQARLDVHVRRVEVGSPGVGVQRVAGLIVARFILS